MADLLGDGRSWVLRPDVVATVLDHGALLLDLQSKYFYQLNPSGWSIVQLLELRATGVHAEERSKAWAPLTPTFRWCARLWDSSLSTGWWSPAPRTRGPRAQRRVPGMHQRSNARRSHCSE